MFTGIIEEIGQVSDVSRAGDDFVLTIQAEKVLGDIHLGDSIAVNGVCLTVTSFTEKQFSVDVMHETLLATSLKTVKRGTKINLERAMAAGGRFGGHFVSGHVDGTGTIKSKRQYENAYYYEIETTSELIRTMIMKGSVAVDGTSLTLFGLTEDTFTLSLIPHTMEESILGMKGVGDVVNIECDMIGKYIYHFLSGKETAKENSTITQQFLENNGFA